MTVSGSVLEGRPLLSGAASGRLLVLDEPLSLWGGLDPVSGVVVDRRHPQFGANVGGRVLAMPFGRGSSSASSVLAEAIRLATAPAGILLRRADEIVVLGALVAAELYGVVCPVLVLVDTDYLELHTNADVEIHVDGRVVVRPVVLG